MNKYKNKLGVILILLTFISCTNAKPEEDIKAPITLEKKVEQPIKEITQKKQIEPKEVIKPKEIKKVGIQKVVSKKKIPKNPEIIKSKLVKIPPVAPKKKEVKVVKSKKTEKNQSAIKMEQEVERLKNLPNVKNASLSLKVMDLDKNKVLYKKNSDRTLIPASNLKLLTTGIALETLGKDYRFETKLVYSGNIGPYGTLNGNIYIIGGGDPTLGSKYLVARSPQWPSRQDKVNQVKFLDRWVEEVKKMGIKRINGDIVADPSYYPEKTLETTWEWGDLRYDFASAPSGLTFMDNNIRLVIKKDPNSNNKTTSIVTPVESKTRITNRVTPGGRKGITVAVVPYSDEIITLGSLGSKTAYYTTIMKDPESTLARMFSERLKMNGVNNNKGRIVRRKEENNYKSIDKSKLIYVNYSPKLEKIISYTNKYSVNLFAEHMKREVEFKTKKSIKQLWRERINTDGLYIYDGSGLSRYDGVTSDIVVEVLNHMKNTKEFKAYYDSLAEPGKIGTFQEFNKGTILVNNLHGKSGTLTTIKAYGGYMHNVDGDLLGFSILLNHHGMSKAAAGKELEKLMEAIYYLK